MTSTRLIRSDETDELERELLVAGESERPSAEARKRTLLALGITEPPRRSGDGAPRNLRRTLTILGRWMSIVVIVAGASLLWVRAHHPSAVTGPTTTTPTAVVAPVSQQTVTALPTASECVDCRHCYERDPVSNDCISLDPAPSIVASSTHAPATRPPPRASSDEGADLAAEVAALDQARRALDGGDPRAALRVLDDYRRRFPIGAMRQEATLLRIEALVRNGETTAARNVADEYLKADPQSAHARRIRHLLGEADDQRQEAAPAVSGSP